MPVARNYTYEAGNLVVFWEGFGWFFDGFVWQVLPQEELAHVMEQQLEMPRKGWVFRGTAAPEIIQALKTVV